MSPARCVIQAFGGVRKTARAVGRQPGAVTLWGKSGRVPVEVQAIVLRLALAGEVDITAHELILGREDPVSPAAALPPLPVLPLIPPLAVRTSCRRQ
jgi:hypothetical protein